MARGKTLWEMLTEWLAGGPVEFKFYNPLKARVGNAVMIDTIDLRDFNFFIQEIRASRRRLRGKDFLSVDYVLLARPLGGEDVSLRLRLNPVDDPTRVSGLTHDALLLKLYDEMGYDQGLHDVVRDDTGLFQVRQDDVVQEEYRRIHDVRGSYRAEVAVLRDANKDGKVQTGEVQRVGIEYWDYWREIKDEAGQPVQQFLFVEMDTESGWFQLWRGAPIDPHKVLLM
ncbi:MAG: hypothetical protein IT429_08995 [Gemmataceae bacterium]|nr:hypothetical protein [Gemmataceae bacterium]